MGSETSDQRYLPRHLRSSVMAALADTPVVCLLGPRQCGKSTLVRHCEPERPCFSLDEQVYLDLALRDKTVPISKSWEL